MRLKNDDLFPANSIDGPEPKVIFGTDAVDGTLAPWYGAPLGTLYVRTASGYVNVWQKFADSGNTTDWRNTMGGVAQTYELTLQSAATATGNGTVAADVGGYGTLLVELSGTFVATVTFEGSQDGTNYYAILGSNMTTGAKATTATGTGVYQINFAGLSYFRARISAYTSGSVTAEATFVASDAGSIITSAASVTVSSSDAGTSIGTTSDAAVVTDTTGTVIGFLRGIVAWVARLGSLDGAAFTAGSSYVWPGLAGVYQSTVGTLTAGQQGLARLTARRAVVTASDPAIASIFSSGGGATNLCGYAVSVDGNIRDTATHTWTAGIIAPGRKWLRAYNSTDQVINIAIYATATATTNNAIYVESIPAGTVWLIAPWAAGTGGTTTKVVPALDYPSSNFQIECRATGSAPTTGTMIIDMIGEM